ncbi:YeeE/YedE family protein [Lutimaribacter sp. EGI FJ00015]|uniref:YeeE/YedE family protein n=1 Tax=Lutimaribacter degradans TaxID=2945989 RepID=A0ACC5ZRX0_9RHOB|nr:YeeE/YedE family protein [Lutimaribacter sp. EGI FJ00013]MCM2560908.1 YeeE/YedE family protein [Lutimaribacter sp. EGI FJ00013]MCO0612147.1 YeeE/YedE family protein [Lutimaribacter sp. EGI FJ00015]MCO0634733.1 YeeE/YedE family protein [Lutimaribacter sp. EGI FJ00014]
MRNIFAFLAGGLFGAGLFISGMTDTAKVQGWLDIFGDWDPTLAFVMGGAMIPMAIAWVLRNRRSSPVLGGSFPPAPPQRIDRTLVTGSVMFGFGWGLVGLCPGPSVASLSYGGVSHWVFFAAMVAGMALTPVLRRALDRQAATA